MPDWLPALMSFEEHSGIWSTYVDALYRAFSKDFTLSCPLFRGKEVVPFGEPVFDGKEATFWHIISAGRIEEDREPDLRRCERIRWVRAVIEHGDAPGMRVWEKECRRRGQSERRIYLWLEERDYLVVLIQQRSCFRLLTAFLTTYGHTRRKLRKEFEEWRRRQAPQKTEAAPEDGSVTPSTHGR